MDATQYADFLRGVAIVDRLDADGMREIANWIDDQTARMHELHETLDEQEARALEMEAALDERLPYVQLGDLFVRTDAIVAVDFALEGSVVMLIRDTERGSMEISYASNTPEYAALLQWLRSQSRVLLGGKVIDKKVSNNE